LAESETGKGRVSPHVHNVARYWQASPFAPRWRAGNHHCGLARLRPDDLYVISSRLGPTARMDRCSLLETKADADPALARCLSARKIPGPFNRVRWRSSARCDGHANRGSESFQAGSLVRPSILHAEAQWRSRGEGPEIGPRFTSFPTVLGPLWKGAAHILMADGAWCQVDRRTVDQSGTTPMS